MSKAKAYDDFANPNGGSRPSPEFVRTCPVLAMNRAFDAGYDARDAEILRLRDLLRRALVHCDISQIEGSRGLYDAIQNELEYVNQEATQ